MFVAYCNSSLLAQCGGSQVIMQHTMLCHDTQLVNESLTSTLVFLANHPVTRRNCLPPAGLTVSQLLLASLQAN